MRNKRILILAGDIRYNLGDTAICAAIIHIVRQVFPSPEITVLSGRPPFASDFDGVEFIEPGIKNGMKRVIAVLSSDLVIWGGGQLLQGNRSRVKIPFWTLNILGLKLLRKKIVGAAQGVGPLNGFVDRLLTRFSIQCTDLFSVRDGESREIVLGLGIQPKRCPLVADPALLLDSVYPGLPRKVRDRPMAQEPLIGLSFRYTLHHRPGRIVPYQYWPARLRRRMLNTGLYERYIQTMTSLCDALVAEWNARLLFIPMYYSPWETDLRIAEAVGRRMKQRERSEILIVKHDLAEVVLAFRRLDLFVGTPMHSTILSTSQEVPTLAVYYEAKGLNYLRVIGQERWGMSLEEIVLPEGPARLFQKVKELWTEREAVRSQLERRMPVVKEQAASMARILTAVG